MEMTDQICVIIVNIYGHYHIIGSYSSVLYTLMYWLLQLPYK